jgi:acyl CoA:acetate/3-ketoacid CoA transferase beta subunit
MRGDGARGDARRDGPPTRAEVCAVALAECFRGDGEILANPIGTLPMIGGRLAKATFEPRLVMTDGEALLVENPVPVGVAQPDKVVSGWNPYRAMFDVVWSGRRHVVMGASQLDRYGNQNFAFIGDHTAPRTQLLGMRGAPGNTVNDKTSYWVPNHSPRVFVEHVSVVSGVGYDRAAAVGPAARFHHLVRVVTNLCVLDFETPDHRMRLRSVHPGVTVDEVVAATGVPLDVPDDVPASRPPTDDELALIREVIDPHGAGEREVAA